MPDRHEAPKRAIGLRYERRRDPIVVAHGRGLVARRILAEADKAGVPVREDAALVEALSALDLGAEIGPELYAAVAEALAWAYSLDRVVTRDAIRSPTNARPPDVQ